MIGAGGWGGEGGNRLGVEEKDQDASPTAPPVVTFLV